MVAPDEASRHCQNNEQKQAIAGYVRLGVHSICWPAPGRLVYHACPWLGPQGVFAP